MSGFTKNNPATRYIAQRLTDPFVLLDIGCSGGIAPSWRAFGERLQAYAFDPNVEEMKRLRDKETNPGILYEDAFVGVPKGHRFAESMAKQDFVRNTPWSRLSVVKSLDRRAAAARDNAALTELNQWKKTALTDKTIYIPDYLHTKGIANVDFVKLDIDGADFFVLQTLFESPLHAGILGMYLEVNFYGTAESDHHTFHNTDRYMREMGFDLFDLSVRHYSSSALPWPYAISAPAQTTFGRPFQGDALYIRDITAPNMQAFSDKLSAEKIAKAVALFSISGHYDQAAEVIEHFSDRLRNLLDVPEVLEILAREIQRPCGTELSRNQYIAAFEAEDPMFYPGWKRQSVSPTLGNTGIAGGASTQHKKRNSLPQKIRKAIKKVLTA